MTSSLMAPSDEYGRPCKQCQRSTHCTPCVTLSQCQMLGTCLTAAASERSCPAVPLTMLRPGVLLCPPTQSCSVLSLFSPSSIDLLPALDLAEVSTEPWRDAPGALRWPLLCVASPKAIFTSWLPEPRMSCLQQPYVASGESRSRSTASSDVSAQDAARSETATIQLQDHIFHAAGVPQQIRVSWEQKFDTCS